MGIFVKTKIMKLFVSLFFLFILLWGNSLFSQPNTDVVSYTKSKLSGSRITLQIPNHFVANTKKADEFVCQPKGSILKFYYIKNISASTFCDSLTPTYFDKQQLTDVISSTHNNLIIYKGKFTNGKINYIRAFCVYPYKKSTVLGIGNYPENLQEEIEQDFFAVFNNFEDE